MPEAYQLILEVCSIGENGTTYLQGDELVLFAETTVYSKVVKCKMEDTKYEQMYTRITAFARDGFIENQIILRERINSFSETSQ
nr:hypothetical protein [uncultured Bacteroides sp.]